MNLSYRYISNNIAVKELLEYRNGKSFDPIRNIQRPGFHLRSLAVPITEDRLIEIRENVLLALEIPRDFLGISMTKENFDRRLTLNCKNIFHDLTEYEAAQPGTWAYITIRLLYDIALLRYEDHADERYIGKPRNTFWRIWQRVSVLGPEMASMLQEDEAVQIFERTGVIASNQTVAQTLAETMLEIRELGNSEISILMREAAKRVRRRLTIISYAGMQESELKNLVKEEMYKSLEQIKDRKNK